jgi:hypothetical protein
MRVRRVLFGAVVAVVLLASAVGTASASRLSLSSQRMLWIWQGANLFRWAPAFAAAACNLTLEVAFYSRTIAKVRNARIGEIGRADVGTCSAMDEVWPTSSLPWILHFDSFTGALPTIASVRVRTDTFEFQNRDESVEERCLIYAAPEAPAYFTMILNGRQEVERVRVDETRRVKGANVPFFGTNCRPEAELIGTGIVPLVQFRLI